MIHSLSWVLGLIALLCATPNLVGDSTEGERSTPPGPDELEAPPEDGSFAFEPAPRGPRNWSIQTGVAVISNSDIGEILTGGLNRADGDAGGLLYSLTANWTARRFEIPCRERILRPQFESYFTLTLVDQDHDAIFPDYNGGIGFRWVDFPWDKWLDTTLFMGIGLSYSSEVYVVDRERHPNEDRSHLKFDWPIQFTFALPRWPQHQLVLFNDHQSGGHVFDEGGVNSFGIGYRFEF
ncbi:MAG: hypothetical protein KJ072_21420 [Verrucomicrobia bacterium]|nr:hypothetical protein [Verrucomicrobiota bacterium]